MYFLLTIFCCLVNPVFFGSPFSTSFAWTWLTPFVAANLVAGWAGLRGASLYSKVLPFICLDIGAVLLLLLVQSVAGIVQGQLLWVGLLASAAIGILMAVMTERGGGVTNSLMPLRGAWSRRLLAGLAVLLMQGTSPGTLGFIEVWSREPMTGPNGAFWPSLWLISSALYLAPVYRRIVEGVSVFVQVPGSPGTGISLEEMLMADAQSSPDPQRSFARFVLRCERRLFRSLIDRGWRTDDAGRRTRALLLNLWRDPGHIDYDILDYDKVVARLDLTNAPLAEPGSERLLVELALRDLPDNMRGLTHSWLQKPDDLEALCRNLNLPEDLAARRIRAGVVELLMRIGGYLPQKPPPKAAGA